MFLPPPPGDLLEWESRFTSRLNAAKNSNYIEKYFKQKLSKNKRRTEDSMDVYLYLP